MSLYDPVLLAQDFVAAVLSAESNSPPFVGDRRHRLLEAGSMDCCVEGDFLALMPSVDTPSANWSDDRTWFRRILGF
jgi:hypothetical protein